MTDGAPQAQARAATPDRRIPNALAEAGPAQPRRVIAVLNVLRTGMIAGIALGALCIAYIFAEEFLGITLGWRISSYMGATKSVALYGFYAGAALAAGCFLIQRVLIFAVFCKYSMGQMMLVLLVVAAAISTVMCLPENYQRAGTVLLSAAVAIALIAFTSTYDPRAGNYIPEFVRQERRRQRRERRKQAAK
jgi:hypothetical protein